MSNYFISYHHFDVDFATILEMRLEQAGLTVWKDDQRLIAGDDWRTAIDRGISECLALLLVMTPEAKASEYVTYEWASAIGAGKKVVPLILREVKLHPRLQTIHYLNFSNPAARPWDKLFAALEVPIPRPTLCDP